MKQGESGIPGDVRKKRKSDILWKVVMEEVFDDLLRFIFPDADQVYDLGRGWRRGMVFEQVQADLEAAGYKVWTYILPAAGIGAPHRRERIWIVAYAGGDGRGGQSAVAAVGDRGDEERMEGEHDADPLWGGGIVADTDGQGWQKWFTGRFRSIFETAGAFPGSTAARRIATPDWNGFPVESPFCVGDDGFSIGLDGIAFRSWRYQSLRGAGNAIVPGVVLQIFRTIGWMEENVYRI